jgi:hypothetical protein
VCELVMKPARRSINNTLDTRDYQIAAGLFEAAFRASKRLPSEDRRRMLSKVAKKVDLHRADCSAEGKTVQIIGIEITCSK